MKNKSYIEQDIEEAALENIHKLKLGKIVIVNNQFVFHTVGSDEQIIKLLQTCNKNQLENKELANSLKKKVDVIIENGFKHKKECIEYIKKQYPTLTFIPSLFIDSSEEYFKVLIQLDPKTKKILVVYPSVVDFCKTNNINAGMVERNINKNKLMGGYLWQKTSQINCNSTTDSGLFQDVLNLNISLPTIKVNQGRGKKITKQVEQYDLAGNLIATYNNIKEASQKLNVTEMTIKFACRNPKRKVQMKYTLKYK